MSNATYNGQWAGAMAELAEQVHLEDPTLEAEEGAPEPEPVRPTRRAATRTRRRRARKSDGG